MADISVELDCLEGVRVVDFTQFEAGPSCTESLAWLGAEVVKIENPGRGDPGRRLAPGTIERLGLGYDEVKKINPGIIYCQVKGFGTGSPYEKSLAFDMIAQAAGGPTSVTGYGDRAPVKPGPSFGDTGTGMLMAI